MTEREQTRRETEPKPMDTGEEGSVCDCLVLDPCGCFVNPCACFRRDEQGCFTDCGCPDRAGEVLRKPLL